MLDPRLVLRGVCARVTFLLVRFRCGLLLLLLHIELRGEGDSSLDDDDDGHFSFAFIDECQWFFTALSVRPGSFSVILAHRLPYFACICMMISSSSDVHGLFLIAGLSWLCHLHKEPTTRATVSHMCSTRSRNTENDQQLTFHGTACHFCQEGTKR